jgi:hypothetical protein
MRSNCLKRAAHCLLLYVAAFALSNAVHAQPNPSAAPFPAPATRAQNTSRQVSKAGFSEAYFYIGEAYLADGDNRHAPEYFQKAVDQGVTEFYEDRASRNELAVSGGGR